LAVPDEDAAYAPATYARHAWRVWRLLPLAVLGLGFVLFFATDLHETFSFELLARRHDTYQAWIAQHPVRALFNFIGVYIVIAAFSLPLSTLMTIASGFLFGPWLGALLSLIGATLGGSILFLAAKTALGDLLRRYTHGAVKRMEEGFRKDAFNYLLVLRLVPAFPFFLVNIVSALLAVPLRTFLAATALGIVPGAMVYTFAGAGLETVIEAGHEPDFGLVMEPHILLPMIGLALLALAPVLYRRWLKRAKTS
jgi:uncharacterized membrane protein YdjX (TVP38/TMEM64 family)